MIALALVLGLMGPAPGAVALDAGSPAPFAGVLVSEERVKQLLIAETERDALRAQLDAEKKVADALNDFYKGKLKEIQANQTPAFLDDPDINRTAGFVAGIIVGVGALAGGAWLAGAVGSTR